MKYNLATTEPTGKRSVYNLKKELESNILETGLCNMNTSNTFHNIKTAITGKC